MANFKQLTTSCTYFGAPYNPANVALKLPGLNAKAAEADSVMAAVDAAGAVYNLKVQVRAVLFDQLDPLTTRIGRAYASMTTNPVMLKSVKALIKKIQSSRSRRASSRLRRPPPGGSVGFLLPTPYFYPPCTASSTLKPRAWSKVPPV